MSERPQTRICVIEDCDRQHYAKGWCEKHYSAWRRNGNPTTVVRYRSGDPDGFWARVNKTDTCWLWTGGTNGERGYGQHTAANGRHVYAHRRSFELANGPIADGLVIDHVCRTRLCVNPAHLEAVTMRENSIRGAHPSYVAHREDRCQKGHPFTEANTKWQGPADRPTRCCRTCVRERARERFARRAAA